MSKENNLERSIGKLEGKMDAMIATMERLASSFDNLEKGRLSTLEINVAKMQTEVSEKSRSTALWTAGTVSIIVGVAVAIVIKVLDL